MRKLLPAFFILFSTILSAQVSPFLPTTWNQTCYYNDSCPTVGSGGSCGRAYTGCNATAMGQICKYYAYPATGLSAHCNSNLPTQCVNFAAQTYNYASMPGNVTSGNAEVARLLYHLGAACDMQYSGTSSNSFFDASVLKRYFAYSPRMYATATFMFNTTQDLIDAIKLELDAGRPVYAKGGNHFYLIDGYNASDNFHMNFGWSGVYDNYYPINSVVNGAGTFTPVNFIFMIRPLTGDLETGNDTIEVAANAGATAFEFTSLLSWNTSTSVPWLSTALGSGTAGYYAYSDGNTFTPQVNQGGIRYGYIFVQNANDTDTIVVKQDASPLAASTDTLFVPDIGGSYGIYVNYFTFSNWNASSPQAWITPTPASALGNTSCTANIALNPNNTPRTGYLVFNGGVYYDTVWVIQDANLSTGIAAENSGSGIKIFPNPTEGKLNILRSSNEATSITILNTLGETVYSQKLNAGETQIDLSGLPSGFYFGRFETEGKQIVRELIIK